MADEKELSAAEIGSKGGKARAAALTPEQRSDIARKAVEARWGDSKIPRATHAGEIQIGDIVLPCAVLSDGRRVLSERGVTKGLGMKRAGSNWVKKDIGARMPIFASANNLKPFMDEDLRMALSAPIPYRPVGPGGSVAHGTPAEVIPKICDLWVRARDAGALTAHQEHVAERAYILMRGFATVGLIALVDEATGYQEVREKDELTRILEAYISEELRPWVHTFPNEFFKQVYRLNGWPFNPNSSKRNQQVGHWINKYIYSPLPLGVLDQLRQKNPRTENGYRAYKHFQALTADIGNEHLDRLLATVTTLLRISDTKRDFEENFRKAFMPNEPRQKRLFVEVPEDDQKPAK